MATTPVPAKGTAWTWGTTAIDQVTSFNGIGLENPTVDVSDLADTWRAYISSGLVDAKPITMEIHWDANNASIHDTLQDDLISGTTRALQVTFADAGTTVYSAAAFLTDFERGGELAGDLTGTLTFKTSDTVTIT
ncbi:MAG TPA: hypothetical protein VMW24_26565 [Sedimentisphaerales bacterium]|nr:hypothetical protein [Sedimentisphaerales bacterium]